MSAPGVFYIFGRRVRFMWFARPNQWVWAVSRDIIDLGPLCIVVSRQSRG